MYIILAIATDATKTKMPGTRIPLYVKERIMMLHKKGKNFSEISRDLHMSECPVSRQSISKFIKWSSGDLKMLLPFKGQTYNPKRVLTMEHANNALLADTVDNVPGTHDLTDEDLPFPSTPVAKDARYSEGTPVSANNLP
jgi:hypothetical protein